MMAELAIVGTPHKQWEAIEKRIKAAFRRELYAPIMADLHVPARILKNSRAVLHDALLDGSVTFANGVFKGTFNSAVSRELRSIGAKWDHRTSGFRLPAMDLPPDLRQVIAVANGRFTDQLKRIDQMLAQKIPAEIAGNSMFSDIFDDALWKVDRDLRKTLREITVAPKLPDTQRQRIADEWQENLKIWIQDFAAEEIVRLREDIMNAAVAGNRRDALVKSIQKSYGVTANKAKFLARQETSLLMAKFKETRYQDAGVNEYRWRCVAGSKLHPVRPSHKILNGKTFRFDDPPVTTASDEAPRRNNPGQDYNCRCSAVPIVQFRKESP